MAGAKIRYAGAVFPVEIEGGGSLTSTEVSKLLAQAPIYFEDFMDDQPLALGGGMYTFGTFTGQHMGGATIQRGYPGGGYNSVLPTEMGTVSMESTGNGAWCSLRNAVTGLMESEAPYALALLCRGHIGPQPVGVAPCRFRIGHVLGGELRGDPGVTMTDSGGFFEYNPAVSPNWRFCQVVGAAATYTDTGIAVVPGVSKDSIFEMVFVFYFEDTQAKVDAYIEGTKVIDGFSTTEDMRLGMGAALETFGAGTVAKAAIDLFAVHNAPARFANWS